MKSSKKEEYKKLKIKNIKLANYGKNYEINIENFLNKESIQDLQVLMFYEYKDENSKELKLRESIEVGEIKKKETPIKIVIKTGKTEKTIGTAEVIDEHHIKPKNIIINNKEINDIEDMFELIKEHDINKYKSIDKIGIDIWENCTGKKELEKYLKEYYFKEKTEQEKKQITKKYISGLFRIYYDSLVYSSIINSTKQIEGKANAMASYIAIKEYLERKGFIISNPNVFIKNINMEFDALIIEKEAKNNFYFEKDEVNSLIEVKTSGFFSSKKELRSKTKEEKDKNKDEKENAFIEYVKDHLKKQEKKELEHKKYIYFSLHESYGSKDTSVHYYEYLFANLLTLDKNKYIGIFCALKKEQNKYLIPYEYDLDKILKKIQEH